MESYCDKHHAASHDYFSSTIWQQHEDYIRPQENGSHYDCDYVQLDGAGIKAYRCRCKAVLLQRLALHAGRVD